MTKEELEKELEKELKNKCVDTSCPVLSVNNQNMRHVAELEKENKELKDKLEILTLVGNTAIKGLNYQLTEAKELLRKFLGAKSLEETFVAESEAKQFLNSEVAK